jgi:hypothetical protein
MNKKLVITLLIAIIAINTILAYYPHFSNQFPILTDEYDHIALGKFISEEHKLPFTNPHLPFEEPHRNFESGFHFLLALIFLIIPLEPIFLYKYLIIIFMITNSILFFSLTKLWFKKDKIALIATLLFGTIKSTGDFLAHNYFLPLTVGITLLLLSFILFSKWEKSYNKKHLFWLAITLIALLFIYPPTLIFFLGTIFLYILSLDHNTNEFFGVTKRKFLIYFAIISGILITLGFTTISLFLSPFIAQAWTPIKANYSPIFFFGIIPAFFAIIGIISLMGENKKPKILFFWIIFSVIQIYLFYIFGHTILIPYRRLFVFYLMGISILASLGIVTSYNYLTNKYKNQTTKIITIIILIVLLSAQLSFALKSSQNEFPERITEQKYKALQFIKNNYPKETIVFANPLDSIIVYPTTGNKVLGTLESNIGGGYQQNLSIIFSNNCDKAKKTVKELSEELMSKNINLRTTPNIIFLSYRKKDCDFLIEKYSNEYFIYEPNLK